MDHRISYLMCKSHDKNLIPIYCEDCECPVCMKCITTTHLQHKMCDASVYFEKRHEELMASLQGENSLIEKMKNELICKRKTLEERKIKLMDDISSREEAIVAEVRDIGKQLKNIVSDAVSECEEKLQESEKKLENLSEIPEFDTETETNCIKILQCHSELRRLEGEMKINDPVNVTFEAVKSLSRRQIEELFGNVVVQHDFCLSSDEDRQIERKSPFHDKNASKILFCKRKIKDQENRVICFQFKSSVDAVKQFRDILFSGGKMFMHVGNKLFVTDDNSVREVLENVDDCVGPSSGHGILVITNKSALSLYLHNGKCMSLFSLQQANRERILAVEENKKLGISFLIEKSFENGFQSFHYKLSIYRVKEDGQVHVISNQNDSQKYFEKSGVAKLCILKDGKSQIAIICRTSWRGTPLKVYNQQLSSLFTYEGRSQNSGFVAGFASVDLDDNILVTNNSDNSIHMLDISGQFLRIVVWPEDGLSNLMSLSVDGEGWLWCLGLNSERSCLILFDYDYLKATERTKRAMTESEENF